MIKEYLKNTEFQNTPNAIEWSNPDEFDLKSKSDQAILKKYLDGGTVEVIYDTVELAAENLFKIDFPDKFDDETAKTKYVNNLVSQGEEYGNWFYFPW